MRTDIGRYREKKRVLQIIAFCLKALAKRNCWRVTDAQNCNCLVLITRCVEQNRNLLWRLCRTTNDPKAYLYSGMGKLGKKKHLQAIEFPWTPRRRAWEINAPLIAETCKLLQSFFIAPMTALHDERQTFTGITAVLSARRRKLKFY